MRDLFHTPVKEQHSTHSNDTSISKEISVIDKLIKNLEKKTSKVTR